MNSNTKDVWYDVLHPRSSAIFTRDEFDHKERRKVWTQSLSSKGKMTSPSSFHDIDSISCHSYGLPSTSNCRAGSVACFVSAKLQACFSGCRRSHVLVFFRCYGRSGFWRRLRPYELQNYASCYFAQRSSTGHAGSYRRCHLDRTVGILIHSVLWEGERLDAYGGVL